MADQSLGAGTVLERDPDVIAVHVGAALVLHAPRGDRYVRLNESAELVWDRLAEPSSIHELAQSLAASYGVDPQRARSDIDSLVPALLERGMLIAVD